MKGEASNQLTSMIVMTRLLPVIRITCMISTGIKQTVFNGSSGSWPVNLGVSGTSLVLTELFMGLAHKLESFLCWTLL